MSFATCILYTHTHTHTHIVQKVSNHVIWKIEAFIEEDTRNIVHRTMTLGPLQSRHLGTSHSSPSCHQLPCNIFLSHQQSEISSLSKVILVLGKARNRRAPNLGCSRAESLEWFDVSPKNSAQDLMHYQVCCHDEAANHQVPIAAAFYIIPIVSAEEYSNLTQNLIQNHCSTHSVILRDDHTVHMLIQWHLLPPLTSTVKSLLFIHVHSSPLYLTARLHWCGASHSHYINNDKTFSG